MLLYFWIVNFNYCRQLKAAFFFYQPFGDLDDTSEWPQSISLWKRNHTENITITLDFLTGSLCQEEKERTTTERIRTANFLSSPFFWKIFHHANTCHSNTKSISKGKMLGQQNCWGCQNLLVPLPGDTWSCVCPGILLLAWVQLYKWERLQTKGQCWHSCGLSRPWLRHITRVVWGEVSINNCSRLASTTTTVELCSWISKRA